MIDGQMDAQDTDILFKINDGGTERTAVQIFGDEGDVSFPRQGSVLAKPSSDQTINNATWTKVNFQTETWDTLGEWDGTNTFTSINGGIYIVMAVVNYDSPSTGRIYQLSFTGTGLRAYSSRDYGDNQSQKGFHLGALVNCDPGETFSIQTYHNTGSSKTLDNRFTHLNIMKVA